MSNAPNATPATIRANPANSLFRFSNFASQISENTRAEQKADEANRTRQPCDNQTDGGHVARLIRFSVEERDDADYQINSADRERKPVEPAETRNEADDHKATDDDADDHARRS